MNRDVIRLDKPAPTAPKKPRWPRRVSEKKQAELDRGELAASVAIVQARSGGSCEIQWTSVVCTGTGTEAHHRLLRSQGGGDGPENLLWTCHDCHMTAHDNPMQARARRIILSRNERS